MKLEPIIAQRILQHANFMESVKPTSRFDFNMAFFRIDKFWEAKVGKECGTVACAAGWAKWNPNFKEQLGCSGSFKETLRFFGIGEEGLHDLYHDEIYNELFSDYLITIKTPQQWAVVARQFVKDNS